MTMLDPRERRERGLATQAELTGRSAPQPETLLEESWRDFIYSEVWTRDGLDRRSRFLIAMASAACSPGPTGALDNYVRGALAGELLTLAELREAALHLAVYGGWSRGEALDRAVTRIAEERGLPPAETAPIRDAPWDAQERLQQGAENFEAVMTFGGPPAMSPYFEAGILNFVFGEMWMRPGLDQRSRRWITVVGVCESGMDIPIHSHIHAAMASGNCTAAELQEFVLQYAIHAGWPRASFIQGAVFAMAKKIDAGEPYVD